MEMEAFIEDISQLLFCYNSNNINIFWTQMFSKQVILQELCFDLGLV